MTDLPDFLVSYLEQRDAERAETVKAKLASLTDWERALVTDAAVMGYVQGMRHPQGEPYPRDVNVVPFVVGECISPAFADLYPALNAETQPTEEQQQHLAFERNQYAAAIRHLLHQVRATACHWVTTLPETIRTADVYSALMGIASHVPVRDELRNDLWQRIVGAYYVRFQNDGHPEDSKAAADEAMTVVQPEIDRLENENARLRQTLNVIDRYAESRCTDEHANFASASWILHLIENPALGEEEAQP